jgi:hypothetical protein
VTNSDFPRRDLIYSRICGNAWRAIAGRRRLFDTQAFTGNLETGYLRAWQRHVD